MKDWVNLERPGYFGRKRDEIIARLNSDHGVDNWRLVWIIPAPNNEASPDYLLAGALEFEDACKTWYQASYVEWLRDHPSDLDFICSFGDVIDNAPTNVSSGLDYRKQEAFSTHIQDIAIRNAVSILQRTFEGPKDKILVIRSKDSEGYKYGPGNIPFIGKHLITQPSKRPWWAYDGSVEDFWQSNKWIQVRSH